MRIACWMARVKGTVQLFFSLSWMAFLIYALLLKMIADDDVTPAQLHDGATHESKHAVLLAQLGFEGTPKLYPQPYHQIDEKEWPIFVLALRPQDIDAHLLNFLLAFRTYFLDHRLIIYNLGFTTKQKDFVQERCYCQVRSVQWSRYPKHVRDIKIQAYIPLLMQETLMEFGSVFWCDVTMRFINKDLKPEISTQALIHGVAAWSRDQYPTSTYTHPHMFRYFNTTTEEFYFHNMVHPTPALYYNIEKLHNYVMLPWIQCSLDENCVKPSGAQSVWCNLNLRPRYLYSGCHRFATSAFNIALGQSVDLDVPYIAKQHVFDFAKDSKYTVFDTITNISSKFIKIS